MGLDPNFATVFVGDSIGCEVPSSIFPTRSEMKLWIFLRLSPLPPQLIFQRDTFSTGGGEGEKSTVFWFIVLIPGQPPSIF